MNKALLSKLKYKQDHSIFTLNIPSEEYSGIFGNTLFPDNLSVDTADFVIVYVSNCTELAHFGLLALTKVHSDSIIWFCYPKQSSGTKTDLNRDQGWQIIKDAGFRPVSACSVNETWSGLRLKKGEWPDTTRKAERPEIIVPEDLQQALLTNPPSLENFVKLSYTHQKEYVKSVEDAKKPETRLRRIEKAVEALLKPKK